MNKTYFDDDAMCKPDNAVLKRTKVYGNKKRLITSTSSAAERATRTNPVSRVQQTQEVRPARGLYSASLPDPKVIRYVPTYPKIHRDHLDLATLQYYDLPWEYSKNDPEYYVVLREMDARETEILFEHTRRLRAGRGRRGPRYSRSRSPERVDVRRKRYCSRSSPRSMSPRSRSRSRDPPMQRYGPEIERIEVDSEVDRRRNRAESDRIEKEMQIEREEKEKTLREKELREYERLAHGARVSDEHEDESVDDSSSDVSGSKFELDVNFLPSMMTDDSMDLDALSTGSGNGLLDHSNHRGEGQKLGPMQESYIISTKWHGSTFDENEFGAEIQVLSTPPAKKAQPLMLRWTHLERPMPSFEEFESAVQKTLVAPPKQRRHVNNLLRKLQRNNEQQRQQGREMKAFCEADVDIEERGLEIQQTSSVCAFSIPFFSLEKSLVAQIGSLSSGSPEHPPRPLLQTHSRMLNESRERAQAVTTLSSTPQDHYLHISHLWCVIVNDDTLVTCSRPPLNHVGKDLKIVTGSSERHSPNGINLRVGDSREWRIPANIVSSAPRFLSLLTDSVLDLMFDNSHAVMKYRGKPVDTSNWNSILDDSTNSGTALFMQRAFPSYHRMKRFEALYHSRNITKLQNWLDGSGIDAIGGSPSGKHESQSPKIWQNVRDMRLYLLSTSGSLEALKDLATGMHQSLSSAKHKVARTSYLSCDEANLGDIQGWLKLHEASVAEDQANASSKRERTIKQHKVIIANLAQGLFGFFWPMDLDHVLGRKFWGALKEILDGEVFYGNGVKDRKKDVDMMEEFLHKLCDRVFDFILPFASAFSGNETDLSKLPEQFYRAWLHITSAFAIAAKAKLDHDHYSNWSEPHERFRSAKEALEEGERALVLRMRRDDIEDFEVCSSRGIVSLMLDCVTRDLMNGRPDVAQTYSDYCRQLEAKMVADPLTRSHQGTLRGLQQELEAVTTILHQQLDVLNSFESSIRDLDCNSRTPDLPLLGESRQELVLRQCKAHINSRLDRFEALQGRANELGEWHLSEIHINKDRQEAAILVFTIVTIIFLPLSFVSSVFGMNTADIRDMAQGQWTYWAAAAPLTIIVVGVSLWFAGAFDNSGSWFSRSVKNTPAGYQQMPASATSKIEKLESRTVEEQKPLILEPRRRTTYPTKRSYA